MAQYPSIAGWPARDNPFFAGIYGFDLPTNAQQGLAPFYDKNGDAVYNPLDGDYPAVFQQGKPPFVPAQMAWTVFNDVGFGNPGTPAGAIALQMETQLLAWVFNCTDQPVLNNTVFTSHKTIYHGTEALDSTAIALFTDFDLGCYLDDYQGCNPATDAVTVQYGDVAVQQIHLFDPTGRLVRSYNAVPSGNMTLSLSGLPSGLYNMQFLTIRACSDFGFEASMSKFCFKEGRICSCSRVPTAKILTHFKIKFAVHSPKSEIRTSSKRQLG